MNTIKLLILLPILLVLQACGTTSTVVKVDSAKTVYTGIPARLLEPCLPKSPISKISYMAMLPHEREQYMADYSITLLGVVKLCNNQLEGIRKIDQANKKIAGKLDESKP